MVMMMTMMTMRMMTMMMTKMMMMIKYIDDDKVYHQSIVGWGDSNDHQPEKEQFCLFVSILFVMVIMIMMIIMIIMILPPTWQIVR